MTKIEYLQDDRIHSCTATIIEISDDPEQPWVVLDRTCLHRSGGGQLADHGQFADRQINDVTLDKTSGKTLHHLDRGGLPVGISAKLSVDRKRRQENSACHSAGHLIAAISEKVYPTLKATKGHHWPGQCRVELCGKELPDKGEALETISSCVSSAIERDLLISRIYEIGGERHIGIGTYGSVPCGGTHVLSTGELSGLKITSVRSKKGVLRISYEVSI